MGNYSAAQLIVAQSTGAVASSPHSAHGLLPSIICGSAPLAGGVLSSFEEVLAGAQLNAPMPSQTSHLRLGIARSVGTEGEAAAKVPEGGRAERTSAGLAGQTVAAELLACIAAASAGPAEIICAELTQPDLAASIGECSDTLALESVDGAAQAYLARQAHLGARLGPGFEGSWLGEEASASLLANAPAEDVAGDARPTALGVAAGQPLWQKPSPTMQSGKPLTGVQAGGAFEPVGFVVGGSALAGNTVQTPAARWSTVAVPAPGEYPLGVDGVMDQTPVDSTNPVSDINPFGSTNSAGNMNAIGKMSAIGPMNPVGSMNPIGTMDPLGSMNTVGLGVSDSAMKVSVSAGSALVEKTDLVHVQVNTAEGLDDSPEAAVRSAENAQRAGKAAERHSAARAEPRADGSHDSESSADPAGRAGQVPQGEAPQTAAPQTETGQTPTNQAGGPARSAARHINGAATFGQEVSGVQASTRALNEAVAASDLPTPGRRSGGFSGDLVGLDARQRADRQVAQEGTSRLEPPDQGARERNAWTPSARHALHAYEVEHGSRSRQLSAFTEQLDSALVAQAREISSRQQRVSLGLENSAGINEAAARRQSIAAEPQTVSAFTGDSSHDRSAGSVNGPMRETAVAGERDSGSAAQAANASPARATSGSSERAANASPARATSGSSERAANASPARATNSSPDSAVNAATEKAMNASSQRTRNTSSDRAQEAAIEHQPRVETASSGMAVAGTKDTSMMDRLAAATQAAGRQSRHLHGSNGTTEAVVRTKPALSEEQPEQPRAVAPTGGSEPMHASARMPERIETGSPETAPAQRAEPRSVIDQIVNRVALSASAERPTIAVRLKPERLGTVEVQVEADRAGRIIASISAETNETTRILRSSSHQLMASLRAQGLQVLEIRIGAAQSARADTGDEDLRHQFGQAQHSDGSSAGFQAGGHGYFEQQWQGRPYQSDADAYWHGRLPEPLGQSDEPSVVAAHMDLRPGRLELRA